MIRLISVTIQPLQPSRLLPISFPKVIFRQRINSVASVGVSADGHVSCWTRLLPLWVLRRSVGINQTACSV